MELILPECVIRPHVAGDEASLARHANDQRIAVNLRDRFPHPYTIEDARAWLAHAATQADVTSWAIAVGGEVIGGIGIIPQHDVYRRSAEIGYWVGAAYWGRGIATAALRAVSDRLFAERDLCRLFAGVFEDNVASARVLEKAGYVLEGRQRKAVTKAGRTVDALLYAKVV